MFTPLHIHTDASLLDGIGQAEAYAARAKQLGLSAMSVTDHGSLAGVPEMVAACRRHGLKPILGMEAYVAIGSRHEHNSVETLGVDADGEKAKFNEHLTLIAATRKGWRNLVALHNTSWESVWRGKPRIDWDLLAEHAEGLICLTGCLGGPVLGPMVQGRRAKARANLERIIAIFGPERTFVEVMEHGIERESAVLGDVAALAADLGVRCVATCDCHYVDEADALAHEAWLAKQRRMTLADERRWRFPGGGYHLMGEEQMRSLRPEPWWGQAVSNTALVEAMVEGDVMPDYRVRLPQPPVPDGFKDVTAWVVDWAKKGSAARYGSPMPEQVRARLNAEIKVFKAKGMVGYAALVGEMIAWAKDQGIEVGPGRGSAGGSVLLYCLGITDVDPLASGTIFARFLDPERAGLPDVDTDFERGRREEVYQHLVDTYGSDQVVRLGTATISGTKASLKDACSQVGIENAWANRLTKTIPGVGDDIPSLDSLLRDPVGEEFRKVLATCPGEREAMLGLARSFEGVRSALSIHACGVVVADENLRDLVPMRLDTATGSWVSVWDGPTCEAMGLVKLDLLGLRTLDQIRAACTIAGIEPGQVPRGDEVGADDPVWDMLAQGETASVFQLESGGMADLCSRLEPHGEDDLTALGALYRPGPMGIGMHLDYADRRTGRAEVSYAAFTADPDEARALESVLGRTFGLIVYQEQIMDLGRLVGGFTASGTNALRKAVAKKHPEEIERLGVLFADGAVRETDDDGNPKHVFARTTAHRLWEAIKSAGKYCFNKCVPSGTLITTADTKTIRVEDLYYTVHGGRGVPSGVCDHCGKRPISLKSKTGICTACRQLVYKYANPDRGLWLLAWDSANGRIKPQRFKDVHYNGVRQVWAITLDDGRVLRSTDNHRWMTAPGVYTTVAEMVPGQTQIAVDGGYERHGYVAKESRTTSGERRTYRREDGRRVGGYIDGGFAQLRDWTQATVANAVCDELDETCSGRLERAHLDGNRCHNTPDNLAWKCVSHHKRWDYAHNKRNRRWGKGHLVAWPTVVSVEPAGLEPVFDVEMAPGTDHNFLADGAVSHNSHSVAYGRLTFTTAWLKAHHPAAFGAATLAVTDTYERRVAAMGWMSRMGIAIAPPRLNEAQVTTTAVDETTVVLGLGEVKGVGGVADQIVAERTQGPYTSITNLTERMRARGVSLTAAAVEAMVKAGSLDEFGPRAGLASATRALMRGPAPVPDIEWEPVTRAKAQLSVLGTMTGQDVLADQAVREAVRQWRHAGGGRARHIRALDRVPVGDFVAVAGTVTAVEHKIGATWRLRVLTLTEEESHIEVACWGQLCDATASITPGAVVVVYGGLRTSSDGQGSQFSTWGVDLLPVAEGVTRLPRSEAVDSLIARLAQSSQH